ncbi:unnamed protein product [Effrenium voratum]|uniref:Uncharacterized protein n=1 Tax=Effrenium voratum TaxID=2562239 RepID=A0AA36IK82_9DINO|nr:unnamed protein product [Effrenium voratum]
MEGLDLLNVTVRSLVGNASVGQGALDIPPETSRTANISELEAYTHFLIYTKSSLVEQSTPEMHQIFDAKANVQNATLVDEDLDLEEIGGRISWLPPPDASRVWLYRAFLAEDELGAGRSQGQDVMAPSLEANLSAELPLEDFTHLVVYTASRLVEQTTPTASELSDTVRVVPRISFDDYDLDLTEVGGTVQWEAPSPDSFVVSYRIVLALRNDSLGNESILALLENETRSSGRWQALATLATQGAEAPSLALKELPLQGATHLLVFAASSLAEQQTPRALEIIDTEARASGLFFSDLDLDLEELAGEITWLEPLDMDFVEQYVVYLASSASGLDRWLLGSGAATNLLVPPETSSGGRSFVLVYTQSVLAEQTTPAALAISDLIAMASNLSFDDYDLDATDLGGNLTWALAEDEAFVTHYVVYFGQSCNGSANVTETWAALLSGSLVFTVQATSAQVEAAVAAALAEQFGASPGDVTISLSSASARRLQGEARRLASSTWLVTYQVLVPSMATARAAQQSSGTALVAKLSVQLQAQGVSGDVAATLVLVEFGSISLSSVAVNSLPELLPWTGLFNGSAVSFRRPAAKATRHDRCN